LNYWLDQSLKRWAHWYQSRLMDKSMGWPSSSPLEHFGMPPSRGNVWDSHIEQDWSDCEELHQVLRKLGHGEFCLLVTYYVDTNCSYRKTGREIGATDKTIKAWLEIVRAKIERMIPQQEKHDETNQSRRQVAACKSA